MKTTKARASEKLPRYNHYVPRFILDNFAHSGKLSILDKHTLRQFKLPPYRAMGEKDYNNVRIGGSVLSFESKFTYIEDHAAPIIAQIIQRKSVSGALAPPCMELPDPEDIRRLFRIGSHIWLTI